jgi:hypothetical protein
MTNKTKNNKNNQGQIAIIVLLVSAVLLTLGLSASKKTITDTKVNTDEELLKEAFNTAESGINNYLNSGGLSTSYSTSDGGKATVGSLPIGNADSLSSEGLVAANTPQLFWLVKHNTDGSVGSNLTDYYTGSNPLTLTVDPGFNGALKVDYFYIEGGVYKSERFGCRYDNNNNPDFNNGFNRICSSLTLPVNRLLLVVTPLGASTNITLSGGSAFPLQGEELTSIGTAGNGVKTQVKTRNIYQIPSFFIESITAKNSIQ